MFKVPLLPLLLLLSLSPRRSECAEANSSLDHPARWCFHQRLPGSQGKWTYLDPDAEWPGLCQLGDEQSPVELPREGEQSLKRASRFTHCFFWGGAPFFMVL